MSETLQSAFNRLCLEPDNVEARAAYRQKQRGVFRPEQRSQLLEAPSSLLAIKMALGTRSDPDEVMRACEEQLQKNPFDVNKKQFQRILGSVDSDDPARHEIAFRALYELAQVQLEAGDRQGAFESLSEIYFRNRSWGHVEEQFLSLNRELAKGP